MKISKRHTALEKSWAEYQTISQVTHILLTQVNSRPIKHGYGKIPKKKKNAQLSQENGKNRKVLPSFFFINLYFFWSYSPNTSDG